MVIRRSRPVLWPAKLLWAPLLAGGVWLVVGARLTSQSIGADVWRVLVTVPPWQQWPGRASFWLGAVLVVLAHVAWWFYRRPEDSRWFAGNAWFHAREHPWFAAAAWVLLVVAAFSAVQLSRHVVAMGGRPFDPGLFSGDVGMDWRFLAQARTHWLDRFTLGASLAGGAACWLLGWGRPTQPGHDEERRQGDQHPAGP